LARFGIRDRGQARALATAQDDTSGISGMTPLNCQPAGLGFIPSNSRSRPSRSGRFAGFRTATAASPPRDAAGLAGHTASTKLVQT